MARCWCLPWACLGQEVDGEFRCPIIRSRLTLGGIGEKPGVVDQRIEDAQVPERNHQL